MEQMVLTTEGMAEIEDNIRKHNTLLNGHMKGVITESCALGYYLRQAQDNGLIEKKGCSGIGEYARMVAGISPSRATNLIKINRIVSVGGYSELVSEEYMEYSESQMQEISNLEDDDRAVIIPQLTVREIHEIRKMELDEERKRKEDEENNLPIIQMADGMIEPPKEEEPSEEIEDRWEKVMGYLFKGMDQELLSKIKNRMISYEDFIEVFKKRSYFVPELNDFLVFDEKKIIHRIYSNGKKHFMEHEPGDLFDAAQDISFEKEPVATPQEEQEHKKKEWEAPEIGEKKVPEHKEKSQDKPVERKAKSDMIEETYKPLPGQTTIADMNIDKTDQEEDSLVSENIDTNMAEEEKKAIDAEYREVEQTEDKQEYTDIEIQNAIGYFETEYYRMVEIGLKESDKCRNYKMALEAIQRYYCK